MFAGDESVCLTAQAPDDIVAIIEESLALCTARQKSLEALLRKFKRGSDALAAPSTVAPPPAAGPSCAPDMAASAAAPAVASPAAADESPECNGLDFEGVKTIDPPPFPTRSGSLHLNPKYHTESHRNDDLYCFLAAAKAGCIGCLATAIKAGMNVNAQSRTEAYTALDWAIHMKRRPATKFLKEQGGCCGPDSADCHDGP